MSGIFVSYSRKNRDFCRQLTDELQKCDREFWVDWEGIEPTVDWRKSIERGIEEADVFLAIVSPDWIVSPICLEELDIAVKNGKRLIPVVPCDIVWNTVPAVLGHLNFIFFTENLDFNTQFSKLLTALDTDYGWLKTHRRLQVKALDWERGNKDHGFLLRGLDLEEAETQISVNATKNPNPTDLQREYILKSRQETDRQNRIRTNSLRAAVTVMLGIIVALVYPYVAEWIDKGRARGEILVIPGGDFYMGATDQSVVAMGERDQWLSNVSTFYMEKYEVTNWQYGLCVKHGACTPPADPSFQDEANKNFPILGIDVYQANAYCRWQGRRLPTEKEWIRAARGQNNRRLWPWNDTPPSRELANMPLDPGIVDAVPQPVTEFPKNISPEGIQNLVGNALEWTSSYYQEDYSYYNAPYDDSQYWNGERDTYNGNQKFIRLGGGWQRLIAYLAEVAPVAGYNTDANTGVRCASD